MQEKSLRHKAALRFAEAGIPIFPCLPDSKVPATEHGFHDASLDPTQIDAWWATADYNLAFTPHSVGWGIVDIDGPEAEAAWAELAQQNNVPETYEVATPRGGRHLYFEGELPTTAWSPKGRRNLGVHLDTRGKGSYALLPPSVVAGKPYSVSRDVDLAPLPGWIIARLDAASSHAAATYDGLDDAGNVLRGREYLDGLVRRGDVAIAGRSGNNRTYQVACDILNLGISPEKTQELIEDIWNPHCVPPWEPGELTTIISNAASYAQNEVGAWAVAPASETFKAALDQLLKDARVERRSRFYFEDVDEQDQAPDPAWLFPEIIPDRATVLMLAKSGDFKSFLAQDMLLSAASGQPFAGVKPARVGPAFYGAHEGRNDIKKGRRHAWQMGRGLDNAATKGFYVAPAPFVAIPEQCEEFREQIRVRLRAGRQKITAVVLDTAAKCMMGLDENSVRDCGIFIGFCDSLRDEFDCSVIVLHHLGKDGKEHGRGSSALVAGFDTIIHIKRVPETLAVELRVLQHKDAEERRAPWTFEGRKVGTSLTFYQTDEKAHRQIAKAADVFEPRKVGQALAELGAHGWAAGVTSAVLATQLTPPNADAQPEDALALQNRTVRALAGLARTQLEAYCQREGRELMWFLPERAAA